LAPKVTETPSQRRQTKISDLLEIEDRLTSVNQSILELAGCELCHLPGHFYAVLGFSHT